MKKAILPIDVELWYETPEERDAKVEVIKTLLTEITKSKDKFNDMKKINNYLAIIKGENRPKWYLVTNISLSLMFVSLLSVIILGISTFRWELVSSTYLGGDSAYWYFLSDAVKDPALEYWKIIITGCNDLACNTDKWVVFRRYIDYYSIF